MGQILLRNISGSINYSLFNINGHDEANLYTRYGPNCMYVANLIEYIVTRVHLGQQLVDIFFWR